MKKAKKAQFPASREETIRAAQKVIDGYRKAKHPSTLDVRDALIELLYMTMPGFKVDQLS